MEISNHIDKPVKNRVRSRRNVRTREKSVPQNVAKKSISVSEVRVLGDSYSKSNNWPH